MKSFYLTGIILLSVFVSGNAQSFRYDTVPNPNKTQGETLYHVEQASQQFQKSESETPVSSGFNKKNIEFGGSFGMVFGDYTSINVAPQIGYAFNKYFSAGGGISYNYYSYDYSDYKQSQNYLGMNLYARVRPIPYIALQIQPEGYYMWGSYSTRGLGTRSDNKESMFVPAVLAGGGAIIPAGRGGISMMIYYDLVQYKKDGINYSPYGDQLVYSVGYVFNF